MTKSYWEVYSPRDEVKRLASALDVDDPIAQVILNRGVSSLEVAKGILSEDVDPFNFENFQKKDLELAKVLIKTAIDEKKSILVYGDYDVDGVTSTTIFFSILRRLGAKVKYHIPHRINEGYGLNPVSIQSLMKADFQLLILLDCGISSVDEIAQLKVSKKDLAIIIFDHHTLPDVAPDVDVILNPRLLEEKHDLYDVCTVGIVYAFMCYFLAEIEDIDLKSYLDLVALGTVADVCPLIGLNRDWVKLGLKMIKETKNVGLRALLENAYQDRQEARMRVLSSRDISYLLAPRINAAGRLDNAYKAVQLFLEEDDKKARQFSDNLEEINLKRRELDKKVLDEIITFIEDEPKLLENRVLCFYNDAWHPGVIGISASRLAQKYAKPTAIISCAGDICRGSVRSYGNVNIYEILLACSKYFETFGGHREAAGFSIFKSNVQAFREFFFEIAFQYISEDMLIPKLTIDAYLGPSFINMSLARQVQRLEPFGQGNPEPIFVTGDLKILDIKLVGKQGQHLKVRFISADQSQIIDGIGFNLGYKIEDILALSYRVAFTLNINTWKNLDTLQLNIIDIQPYKA